MLVGGEATATGGSTGSPQSTLTMQEAGKNDEEQKDNATGPAADQGGDTAAGTGQTMIDDPPEAPPGLGEADNDTNGNGEDHDDEENDNDTPFVFENEVLVSGRVVIQGNSVVLPFLDCALSTRCFRILAGGYLELRYVRINQSDKGVLRPVNPLFEGMTPTGMVREYRGASLYFEPGATGGRFLGAYFDDDQSDESE